jgi:hypothetical protein
MVPYILAGTQSDSLMVNKTDIVKIYNDVRELEHSDSLKTEQIIILKDLINKKDFLISQLEENSRIDSMYIEIYKEQANLNEPTI